MERYRITGIDCAQCANDIERALQNTESLENSTIDFATERITVPADQLEKARRIVARVDTGARIVDPTEERLPERETAGALRYQIIRVVLSLVLMAFGLLFQRALRATPYGAAEYAVFLTAYLLVGTPVLLAAVRNLLRGRVFDEMFLMSVATIGAIAIRELPEAAAVMLFYSVGEYFQNRAVASSRRSISALMDLRPDQARIITENGVQVTAPDMVPTGSVIEVLPGERIPLDGVVIHGESSADTSALTGEAVPRTIGPDDPVLAGFINDTGRIRVRTTRPFAESSVSRILELVENAASQKAPTERFISRFAGVYTPVMVSIAAAIALLPPLIIPGALFSDWLYRALVVLVISCPCALVISIPLSYFGGIGGASRSRILIKGANYVDALKDVTTVVLDKTGTVTRGVFDVIQVVPHNGFSRDDLLHIAAAAESSSTHPIAKSILRAYGESIEPDRVTDITENKGLGVTATVDGMRVLVGSDRLMRREKIQHAAVETTGTVVHVVQGDTYAGHLIIADEIKSEVRAAVDRMKATGINRIIMLTGDNRRIAAHVAEEIGVDEFFAELLPEDKVARVEELKEALPAEEKLAFVGDGINDAPVLMRSDVGFAMGALGSDAAIEAADVVLMDDSFSGVPGAFEIARYTRKIVIQNILLALLVKAVFVGLGAFGVATMWEAVIADVGVTLLAVFNATRTLKFSRGRNFPRETGSLS